MSERIFAAHTDPETPERPVHALDAHLKGVGDRARAFADLFGGGEWAGLAGLWHDLGKYHPEFQKYLRNDPDAHVRDGRMGKKRGVNHSLGGALWAMERFGPQDRRSRVPAYLIGCHHSGLTDWHGGLGDRLCDESERALFETVKAQAIPRDILDAPLPCTTLPPGADAEFGRSLWVRMLFSCLVDADFLDTEAYLDEARTDNRGGYPDLSALRENLDAFFRKRDLDLKQERKDSLPLNVRRAEILAQCREKAGSPPGLFSLSVPTGGGKTLSSMAFALDHAIRHGKGRVIYVIPFTSIIEQNAKVFKDVFGAENVIEHHSNFDHGENENARSRLACENWDAPIVVTTNVQFFESLFAARTGRVRKLHNIVNSVVVLDEAQLLPVEFLRPVLKAIEQLQTVYKTTFVFCTATQPALGRENNPALKDFGLRGIEEIIRDPAALARDLERVRIHIPDDLNTPREWEDIARDMLGHARVLCIVNRRDDARDLYRILKDKGAEDGLYHLSALMCPAHRSAVIEEIRDRLKKDETAPVRVVSTQLIEAGVDIDFPVVYRAMAGLDSIAQAAGRCNREGRLGPGGGNVFVFVPPKPAPVGLLRKAEESGREVLRGLPESGEDFTSPDIFLRYFQHFYARASSLDKAGILGNLKDQGVLEFSFLTAARAFKLIDEDASAPVIAWRESDNVEVSTCLNMLRAGKIDRWIFRKLQRFTVTIPKPWHVRLLKDGDIEEIVPGLFVQKSLHLYNHGIGFVGSDARFQMPENFIA